MSHVSKLLDIYPIALCWRCSQKWLGNNDETFQYPQLRMANNYWPNGQNGWLTKRGSHMSPPASEFSVVTLDIAAVCQLVWRYVATVEFQRHSPTSRCAIRASGTNTAIGPASLICGTNEPMVFHREESLDRELASQQEVEVGSWHHSLVWVPQEASKPGSDLWSSCRKSTFHISWETPMDFFYGEILIQ